MSEVVSFKVRREVKEKMIKYKGVVNWSEELRRFVEEKIKELEARENFQLVMRELRAASWSVPKGFVSRSVREDRDSG
ncbi:MAG: CopG family transcriptional regulator [Thermoprotei archaeon]|nr:MAG: CopG family transcriptional regulator [Thermoprotei archaeon]